MKNWSGTSRVVGMDGMGWMNLNIYWQRGNDGKEAMLAIRFKEAMLTIEHGWQ